MAKITDLPPEVIALIVSFLPSSDGQRQLPDPQMIRNVRSAGSFFNNQQDGWYKALIKRYDPIINWTEIESQHKKHLLPSWMRYELFYRKSLVQISASTRIVWLYESLPKDFPGKDLINLLLSAIQIGNSELCRSLLLNYMFGGSVEFTINIMLKTAFQFNRRKIVSEILQHLNRNEALRPLNINSSFNMDRSRVYITVHFKDMLISVMIIKDLVLLQSLLAKYMPNWERNINYAREILGYSLGCVYEEGTLYILEQLDHRLLRPLNISKLFNLTVRVANTLGLIELLQILRTKWGHGLANYEQGYLIGILKHTKVFEYKQYDSYEEDRLNINGNMRSVVNKNLQNFLEGRQLKQEDYEKLFQLYGEPTKDQYYMWFIFLCLSEVEVLEENTHLKNSVSFFTKMCALFGLSCKEVDYENFRGWGGVWRAPSELLDYLLTRCSEAALKNLLVTNINNVADVYMRLSLTNKDKKAAQKIKDVLLRFIAQKASDTSICLLMDMAYRCQQRESFQKHLMITIVNLHNRVNPNDKKSIISILNHIAAHYLSDLTPQHKENLIKVARELDEVELMEAFELNSPSMTTATVASTRCLR